MHDRKKSFLLKKVKVGNLFSYTSTMDTYNKKEMVIKKCITPDNIESIKSSIGNASVFILKYNKVWIEEI